jgi:hypothetical protein
MNRITYVLAVGAIASLAVSSRGEEAQTNATLRLAIDLVDGSRLIGTPGLATVPVQTSYAKMDVPLTQIKALKIGDDHETVTLNLRNGDTLTGVISLAPIKLITVFGTVAVGIEHIQQLDIVLSGGTGQKGLVLWNRLGSESEVKNSRVGPGGKLNAGRFVEGRFGQGIELNMKESFGVTFPYDLLSTPAGCIEFWCKISDLPASSIGGGNLDVIGWGSPEKIEGEVLFFSANDGCANGGLCLRSGVGSIGTGNFGSWTYSDAIGGGSIADWHHYAVVWNTAGITGMEDGARKAAVFVDGKLNSAHGIFANAPHFLDLPKDSRIGLLWSHTSTPGRIAFDNLKIWNYAKTNFNYRTDE